MMTDLAAGLVTIAAASWLDQGNSAALTRANRRKRANSAIIRPARLLTR
jgi:hypothetical protein